MKRVLVGLLVSILGCTAAWAQSTAQISGVVKDQSGAILPGVDVCRSHFTPNFVLAVRAVTRHHLLKVLNRVNQSLLDPGDASQLVMRVNLFIVDLDRTFETFARRREFAALLVNQPEVVMG